MVWLNCTHEIGSEDVFNGNHSIIYLLGAESPWRGGLRGAAGTRRDGRCRRILRQRGECEGHQRRQLPHLRRGRRGQLQAVGDARPGTYTVAISI